MDQMLKSHRCFHLNKEGFVLSNLLALLYIYKYTNSQSLLNLVLRSKLKLHCQTTSQCHVKKPQLSLIMALTTSIFTFKFWSFTSKIFEIFSNN
ncbi:hypothetical protein BpHYR1_009433 [Brachionus plicatilis]|uniref:Uncharacterized protein n=1 Tax=Brachionus plicatilis TaxID=10195 RepID=A0A3M7R5E9_BRAPC|nr:hypothetical protein BpHYR1_009433 [Brachionus plicatilis]